MQATKLDAFTIAYITAAIWSSVDDDGKPLDADHDDSDLAPEALAAMVADCEAFQRDHAADLEGLDVDQCGQDFWLTRNGHGAGFWDRGYGQLGDKLSKASEVYGECNLYVDDDGSVRIM